MVDAEGGAGADDPRRRLSVKFLNAQMDGDELVVSFKDMTTGEHGGRAARIVQPAHREFALTRAKELFDGLRPEHQGLIRHSDIDNLLTVASHTRDISRMRKWPFIHQVEDMETVLVNPFFFITSEMRTGKSKIVADSSQIAFELRDLDRVIVVAPAPVRDVWYDDVLGEMMKHLFVDKTIVMEYHTRTRAWQWDGGKAKFQGFNRAPAPGERRLEVIVTNFEFLRKKDRLAALLKMCGPKVGIIGDESSFLRTHDSQQSKAFKKLRYACGRVLLLNGTPIFHSPMDLFSQGNILHPKILGTKYVGVFKARYAIQEAVRGAGGKALQTPYGDVIHRVTKWVNLEDLQQRFAPYVVRRLQKDCLDLPPKLDPVTLTVPMDAATWAAYKSMRDDMVVWFGSHVATAMTAAIKVMRLAQITSGFLGGIEEVGDEDQTPAPVDDAPAYLSLFDEDISSCQVADTPVPASLKRKMATATEAIGSEKLNLLLWFIEQRLEADPNLHLVAWCKFRPEMARILAAVQEKFPQFETGALMGGQKKSDRLRALSLLKPETSPTGPTFVVGIEGTGSFGLDMTAAHTCITVSTGYSHGKSAQTLDRVYGPGQREPVAYFNIVATGPKGQRTIDHDIIAALMSGENVANRTQAAWIKAIKGE